MGQFYGEISVIFFLSFRLKTAAFSLPFGVFVSTSREKEKEEEKEKEKERERETFVSVSKNAFFFISSSLSRARICAHLRAHIISLFFCVRARTRARKSHALLSSINLYR